MVTVREGVVLIVEDDEGLASLLVDELTDRGFDVESVASAEEGWDRIGEGGVVLVISDLRLPGAGGEALLAQVRGLEDPPAFIVITAFGTVAQAVDCLKTGADDFLTKPLDLEHLAMAAERALEHRRLRRMVARYEEVMDGPDFHGMIGQSEVMRRVFEQVQALARSDGPVLIEGESGVGKELVAKAVHMESPRSDHPFLAVNCAGVPKDLLESEFFGHAEGAFTGASKARRGLFEEAGGGTLFLDEIAEMSPALQAKLLRVLQEGTVRPVGSNRSRSVDVRIIAATNQDLEAEMAAGGFREDLFYRLETFRLRVPPLRERGTDLERLTGYFVKKHAARLDRDIRGLTPAALERVQAYAFPGNVRELENAIERAAAFCSGHLIDVADLPARVRAAGSRSEDWPGMVGPAFGEAPFDGRLPTLARLEGAYIRHVLDETGGNKRRAAEMLGISRRTLYRRLAELEGDAPSGIQRDA